MRSQRISAGAIVAFAGDVTLRKLPVDPQRAKLHTLLSQISILRSCGPAQIDMLGSYATVTRHDRGDHIVEQSTRATSMLLVAHGRVRILFRGDDGREIIFTDLEAGATLGDEALTQRFRSRASAIALEETTIVSIPAAEFAAFVAVHPRVALELTTQLSGQLTAAYEAFAGAALLSVEERLLRTFHELAVQQRRGRRPTHSELASRIGVRRETVTRALRSLARRGLTPSLAPTIASPHSQ